MAVFGHDKCGAAGVERESRADRHCLIGPKHAVVGVAARDGGGERNKDAVGIRPGRTRRVGRQSKGIQAFGDALDRISRVEVGVGKR